MIMKTLDAAIRMCDADNNEEWITIKGSHILIGGNGEVKGGNKNLVSKLKQGEPNKSEPHWESIGKAFDKTKLNTKTESDHPQTGWLEDYERVELLKERTGIDDEWDEDTNLEYVASDTVDALNDYTGEEYGSIIKSQIDGKPSYKAKLIENFIKASPKFSGDIRREIFMDKEDVDKLKVGDIFDNRGAMSSWTSGDTYISDDDVYDKSVVSIVLKGGTKYGTSVTSFSAKGDDEKEVLVSKNQRCKIKNIKTEGKRCIVEVEEV